MTRQCRADRAKPPARAETRAFRGGCLCLPERLAVRLRSLPQPFDRWRTAMSNENGRGFEGRGIADHKGDDTSLTRSQTGMDTQGRSADYNDDRLGEDRMLDGKHAVDLKRE